MDKTLIETSLPENNRMKEYLNNLWTNKWSMAEFNKECAYWFISCDDLSPLQLPTRPKELLEYDRWSPSEKKNTSEKFWRQEIIYKYLNQKQFVRGRNRGMLDKLIEFKSYIPKEDITTIEKFDRLIIEYREFFNPLQDVIDTFGGKVVNRGYKDEPF